MLYSEPPRASLHSDSHTENWSPPTPPPSSPPRPSQTMDMCQDALSSPQGCEASRPTRDPAHDIATSNAHLKTEAQRTARLNRARQRPSKLLRQQSAGDNKTGQAMESGSDWHSRFVLQCKQRAKQERWTMYNRHRNGLLGDATRPNAESQEELAYWRRLYMKDVMNREQELSRYFDDHEEEMLRLLSQIEEEAASSGICYIIITLACILCTDISTLNTCHWSEPEPAESRETTAQIQLFYEGHDSEDCKMDD